MPPLPFRPVQTTKLEYSVIRAQRFTKRENHGERISMRVSQRISMRTSLEVLISLDLMITTSTMQSADESVSVRVKQEYESERERMRAQWCGISTRESVARSDAVVTVVDGALRGRGQCR